MDLIDLSQQPATARPFREYLRHVCERFEMDYGAYAGFNPIGNSIHGHVTYPDSWKRHYIKRNFHLIDPTIHAAKRSISPVDWSRLSHSAVQSPVFRDARDFCISGHGLTIPVRGPYGDVGMLSVTKRCSRREWEMLVSSHLAHLQSAAVHLHDHVMTSDALSNALRFPHLSKREREIMQWIASGKTQNDVADILAISSRTVEVHLRSARTKLFALTTAQAVGRAIALGLIYPS